MLLRPCQVAGQMRQHGSDDPIGPVVRLFEKPVLDVRLQKVREKIDTLGAFHNVVGELHGELSIIRITACGPSV